jgi:hypothetical protein
MYTLHWVPTVGTLYKNSLKSPWKDIETSTKTPFQIIINKNQPSSQKKNSQPTVKPPSSQPLNLQAQGTWLPADPSTARSNPPLRLSLDAEGRMEIHGFL